MAKKNRNATAEAPFMVRQGDVLVMATDEEPSPRHKADREEDGVILAAGEATGHHHRIRGPAATLLRAEGISDAVLTIGAAALLTHEEHAAIEIPAGTFVVRRQCEYSEEEVRRVED